MHTAMSERSRCNGDGTVLVTVLLIVMSTLPMPDAFYTQEAECACVVVCVCGGGVSAADRTVTCMLLRGGA
jgi:hypothetical protein